MRVIQWFFTRLQKTFEHDHSFSLKTFSGLGMTSTLFALILISGAPTGLGVWVDYLLVYVFHLTALGIVSVVSAFLLALVYVPVPRFLAGGVVYHFTLVAVALYNDSLGTFMACLIAAVYTIIGLVIGLSIAMLTDDRVNGKVKGFVLLCVLSSGFLFIQGVIPSSDLQYETKIAEEPAVSMIEAENPSEPGPYEVNYFTYGNGQDRYREEFAEEVSIVSRSVDARPYSKRWPKEKHWFWGFGLDELPLNGRVWMPDALGQYPLVLIVHGNAIMEKFSDAGYAYIGELLASRGFIAISVDQNFLNYSHWSKIVQHNMKLRAWMLLQHLVQIQVFAQEPGNPFYQQVDFERIALVGHSRGGQAAAMAADYRRFFADDESLDPLEQVEIRAVAALSPTDTRVDDQRARLRDTYYLVLQGADDADVSNFYGERHFNRAQFSSGSERFKATLYIDGANHSYFNTDWGTIDLNVPGGLFLNLEHQLTPAEQRQIAMVYVSAFMETALLDNPTYIELFRDYRKGEAWLPQTAYFNRFENGTFTPVTRFAANTDETEPGRGLIGESQHIKHSEVMSAVDRKERNKGTSGLVLQWDSAASYSIQLADHVTQHFQDRPVDRFVFSMANLDHELGTEAGAPHVEIALKSRNGEVARIALNSIKAVQPSMFTRFTHWPWLEERMKNGAYRQAAESVFQTYEIPLAAFEEVNPALNVNELVEITYYFGEKPGKVMLDDLGFSS